jgi:hypothetical protein
MITYELTAAIFAEVILLPLFFFPFPVMLGLWQGGHLISMVICIIP